MYTHHLHQWKQDFMRSKTDTTDTLATQNRALKTENKQLQRELARKDKALAEAAALLILQKKVQTLFGWDEEK